MKILDQKQYQNRRNILFQNMEENSVLLVGGETEKVRNNDVNFDFRQDSIFWYLTGIEEADALMMMLKKDSEKYILFLQEKKIEEEVWTGYKIGNEKAKSFYLANDSYKNDETERVIEILLSCEKIYYNLGSSEKIDKLIIEGLEQFKKIKSRIGIPNPMIIDPSVLIDRMRLKKSNEEK